MLNKVSPQDRRDPSAGAVGEPMHCGEAQLARTHHQPAHAQQRPAAAAAAAATAAAAAAVAAAATANSEALRVERAVLAAQRAERRRPERRRA